jgi:hypothetical protein
VDLEIPRGQSYKSSAWNCTMHLVSIEPMQDQGAAGPPHRKLGANEACGGEGTAPVSR